MFLPIPTQISRKSDRHSPSVVNHGLIAINVVVFVLGYSWTWGVGAGTSLVSILSYAFVHADAFHLIGNMWILWLFGNAVNQRIGNANYLLSYLGIAISLGLFARLFSTGLLLGSSGAIFGIVAIATILLPASTVRVHYIALFPITLLIGMIKKPQHWLEWLITWDHFSLRMLFAFILIPVMELWGLWRWSCVGQLSWTNLAHLMGFVLGVFAVMLLPTRVSMNSAVRA